jgi:hypothetical protein
MFNEYKPLPDDGEKNLFTEVLFRIFLNPSLDTPMPTMENVLTWTRDEKMTE